MSRTTAFFTLGSLEWTTAGGTGLTNGNQTAPINNGEQFQITQNSSEKKLAAGDSITVTVTAKYTQKKDNPTCNPADVNDANRCITLETRTPGAKRVARQAPPLPHTPGIQVVKASPQANRQGFHGGNVTYTYTVTNTGTEPLTGVTLQDDGVQGAAAATGNPAGDTNGDGLLDTNETWVYTVQDVDTQQTTTGTAKVTATGNISQTRVGHQHELTITVTPAPAPAQEKEGGGSRKGFREPPQGLRWCLLEP